MSYIIIAYKAVRAQNPPPHPFFARNPPRPAASSVLCTERPATSSVLCTEPPSTCRVIRFVHRTRVDPLCHPFCARNPRRPAVSSILCTKRPTTSSVLCTEPPSTCHIVRFVEPASTRPPTSNTFLVTSK
jgi:hypothetical protein